MTIRFKFNWYKNIISLSSIDGYDGTDRLINPRSFPLFFLLLPVIYFSSLFLCSLILWLVVVTVIKYHTYSNSCCCCYQFQMNQDTYSKWWCVFYTTFSMLYDILMIHPVKEKKNRIRFYCCRIFIALGGWVLLLLLLCCVLLLRLWRIYFLVSSFLILSS